MRIIDSQSTGGGPRLITTGDPSISFNTSGSKKNGPCTGEAGCWIGLDYKNIYFRQYQFKPYHPSCTQNTLKTEETLLTALFINFATYIYYYLKTKKKPIRNVTNLSSDIRTIRHYFNSICDWITFRPMQLSEKETSRFQKIYIKKNLMRNNLKRLFFYTIKIPS